MKKLLSFFLAGILLLCALSACDGNIEKKSGWQDAYFETMLNYPEYPFSFEHGLIDFNFDGVPELLISSYHDSYWAVSIYTYQKGRVIELEQVKHSRFNPWNYTYPVCFRDRTTNELVWVITSEHRVFIDAENFLYPFSFDFEAHSEIMLLPQLRISLNRLVFNRRYVSQEEFDAAWEQWFDTHELVDVPGYRELRYARGELLWQDLLAAGEYFDTPSLPLDTPMPKVRVYR